MMQKMLQKQIADVQPISGQALGQFQRSYTSSSLPERITLYGGVGLLLLCGILLLLSNFLHTNSLLQSPLFININVVVIIVSSVLILLSRYFSLTYAMSIYTKGMVFLQYHHSITLTWQDVHSIWQHPQKKRYQQHRDYSYSCYLLRTKQNEFLEIRNKEAGLLLNRLITQAQLPLALERLQTGEELTFGPWVANSMGLYKPGHFSKNHVINWHSIECILPASNFLSLYATNNTLWGSVDTRSVANLFLLINLHQVMRTAPLIEPKQPRFDFAVDPYPRSEIASLNGPIHEYAHMYKMGRFFYSYEGKTIDRPFLKPSFWRSSLSVSWLFIVIMANIFSVSQMRILGSLLLFFFAVVAFFSRGKISAHQEKRSFHLFERGVILQQSSKASTMIDTYTVDNIAASWQYSKRESSFWGQKKLYYYRFLRRDGLEFTSMHDFASEKVGFTALFERLANHLFEQMNAQYQQGETLPFGDLTLNQQGITYNGKMVAWQKIHSFAFDPDSHTAIKIEIRDNEHISRWISLPTEKVPNALVLQKLIQAYKIVPSAKKKYLFY